MIGDWSRFSDPLNDVHRPSQMGPLWVQAGTMTGMPIEAAVWVHDPPASSWPACLAVKAASLQSPAAADLYLRGLREALMVGGHNIARDEVLIDVARALAAARPDVFDITTFEADLAGREAQIALEEDVREARFRCIGRFPCLGLRRSGAEPAWLVGWRPWHELLPAVRGFAPELGAERKASNTESYAIYWGGVTEREIAVAFGRPEQVAQRGLEGSFSSGSHA